MPRRHPIPRVWLMTDERIGAALWDAVARLPRGAGIVVRDDRRPPAERRALLRRMVAIGRARGLTVLGAGGLDTRDGVHNGRRRRGWLSRSAHDRRELIAAARAGADLVFVSPVHATRSHPGARSLGRVRLGLMIRGAPMPVIALGGMTPRRARAVARLGVHGWAAIDFWLPAP